MRKLKIGADADDFMLEFTDGFYEFCKKIYGHSVKRRDVTTYDFWKVLGVTRDESRGLIDEYYTHPMFMETEPIPGAVLAMRELKADGHELFVITSRPDFAREVTFRQFDKHFQGIFKDIFFSYNIHALRGGMTKKEICEAQRIDVFGDDSRDYVADCAVPGRLSCLYSHEGTPWNLKPIEDEEAKGIFRFSQFPEFVKRVREFAVNGK